MPAKFVSEQLTPDIASFDMAGQAIGEPALPMRFRWRGEERRIEMVLESWKETGPCTHGSGERYVRKHWYRVRTNGGLEMKIYYERRSGTSPGSKARWWIFTVEES